VLSYPGGEYAMTIAEASEGNDGIDLGKMLASTGYVTYDPGFMNTAPTKSAITYIDGEAGILRYRGYPIDQLAGSSTFIEVSYLLIYGELPTPAQLDDFTDRIRRPHPAARGPEAVLRRLPAQRAPDAGALLCGERTVGLLPGLA